MFHQKKKAMKKLAMMLLAACAMFAMPQAADAQLGKLVKKANKALEKVSGVTEQVTSGGSSVALEGGGTMSNPLSKVLEVEFLGAKGTGTSLNYGNVSLEFKMKIIPNLSDITVRCAGWSNTDIRLSAIDEDGNTYYPASRYDAKHVNVSEGVWVKVTVDGNFAFKDVKKSVTKLQVVKVPVNVDKDNDGTIILRDIPVTWEETAE